MRFFHRHLARVLAVALTALAVPSGALAGLPTIIFVDASAAPGGTGQTWPTAYNSLHLALDQARTAPNPDGVVIRVAAGTYRPYNPGDTPTLFAVPANTQVFGGYAPNLPGAPRDPVATPTIITGDINGDDTAEGGNRAENMNTAISPIDATALPSFVYTSDVVLDGLTIERCGFGGNIAFASGPRTTIRKCIIRRNYGSFSLNADTILEDTVFEDNFNRAFSVTALNAQGRPTGEVFTLARCTFRRNGRYLNLGSMIDDTMIFRIEGAQVHATDCHFQEHPFGVVAGVRGIFLYDRTPYPGGVSRYNHVFERCDFSDIEPYVFEQQILNPPAQLVTLTDCRFESLTQSIASSGIAAIDASGTAFNDFGASPSAWARYASRFSNCEFRNARRVTVGGSANAASVFQESMISDCVFESTRMSPLRTASIDRCTFFGSGQAATGASLTMRDCEVSNIVTATPREVVNAPTLSIARTRFTGCDADAIVTATTALRMDATRFVGNLRGSCVVTGSGPCTIVNCEFVGNTPGGTRPLLQTNPTTVSSTNILWNTGKTFVTTSASRSLHNSIVWGNRDGSASSIEAQQLGSMAQSSPSIDSCVIEGWTGSLAGTDITGADPVFVDALGPDLAPGTGDEDFRLSPLSPIIDAGNAALLPPDALDLDTDTDTAEPVPFDLDSGPRIVITPMYSGDPGDALDIGAREYQADCNENGVFDLDDIDLGTSFDCNANLIPDECEADCDSDGIPDECEIAQGIESDCNGNGLPDSCDIASGTSLDCNANGIPDECDPDCNGNGIPDECDIAAGDAEDCNLDGIPDSCRTEVQYTVDDGNNYANRNVSLVYVYSSAPPPPVISTMYFTQNTVEPGGETIHEIEFFAGSLEEIQVFVTLYDDPNNDGDPDDATLIAAYPVSHPLTTFKGPEAYRVQAIPATYVGEPGDSFFAGVWFTFVGPTTQRYEVSNPFAGLVRSACEDQRCFTAPELEFSLLRTPGLSPNVRSMAEIGAALGNLVWRCSNPPTASTTPSMSMHIRPRTLSAYDCDLNLKPDACDPFPDINANGVPDGCECPGDVTGDGRVDISDFNVLASGFGRSDAFWFDGDLTGDHAVNASDFCILAFTYGDVCKQLPAPALRDASAPADPMPMLAPN